MVEIATHYMKEFFNILLAPTAISCHKQLLLHKKIIGIAPPLELKKPEAIFWHRVFCMLIA
jgi:hypothetical protein